MSLFSHYEPCPKCRANGRDNRGDNCGVYKDGSKHCYSCGWHHFSTFNYWKNKLVSDVKENGTKGLYPPDFERQVPAIAWKWLLQYGLPYSYWQPYVGWSAQTNRLTFTVGTPTAFTIGRYIEPEGTEETNSNSILSGSSNGANDRGGGASSSTRAQERYFSARMGLGARSETRCVDEGTQRTSEGERCTTIGSTSDKRTDREMQDSSRAHRASNAGLHVDLERKVLVSKEDSNRHAPRKWHVWGDAHKHCEVISPSDRSLQVPNYVCLVEDIVSAHKVGQIANCIPLFGTRIYNPTLYYLINENKPVVLWLDKDQEQNVKRQALQLESVINQPVRVVVTDKDPKAYTTKQIMDIIYG